MSNNNMTNLIQEEINATRRVREKMVAEFFKDTGSTASPIGDHLSGYIAALEDRPPLTMPHWKATACGLIRAAQFNGGWHEGRRWLLRETALRASSAIVPIVPFFGIGDLSNLPV